MAEISKPACEHVVIDSAPIITGSLNRSLFSHAYTVPEVLAEIKDTRSKAYLETTLGFDLKIVSPTEKSIGEIARFSKITGDFKSLSSTDILLLALTLDLTNEKDPHRVLREQPLSPRVQLGGGDQTALEETPFAESQDEEDGWITPQNIPQHQATCLSSPSSSAVKVACSTEDFSMQNVLLHKGLCLFDSSRGLSIREVRSHLLRCHACYKLVWDMQRQFCPDCGHDSLLKASYSLGEDGQVNVYLKKNFQYRIRGTKYSVPTPRGGKSSNILILSEDQKEYQRALYQTKKIERNLLDPDCAVFSEGKNQRHSVTIGYGKRNVNEAHRRRK